MPIHHSLWRVGSTPAGRLRYSSGKSLDEAFGARFGQPLDPDTLNQSHQIVIVASELDAASERIVGYSPPR